MPQGNVAPTKETPQAGDLIGSTTGNHSSVQGSAQEQYYRYMLMKEKITNKGNASVPEVLRATSEREEIEYKILEKLVKITESSPEFAQLVSITGSTDRFEQARILAEAVYDKVRAEQVLSFYTPDRKELLENFYSKTLTSSEDRFKKVASGAATNGSTLSAALRAFIAP